MTTFTFDGTFEGLLTCIFDYYDQKPGKVKLIRNTDYHPELLVQEVEVISDGAKAERVWAGLKKKLSTDWSNRFYKAFLSEQPDIFQHLLEFAIYIFDNPPGAEQNYGHPAVIAISQMQKSVDRERHRMKAFIRFQETADGIFYAAVEPDFNVLPLIAAFFRNRYADQRWIIYDLKRSYGLYYDLVKVEEVTFEQADMASNATVKLPSGAASDKEELYKLLWGDYFRSTNIPARRNMKLHIQHVPKRYWKYLSEKNP